MSRAQGSVVGQRPCHALMPWILWTEDELQYLFHDTVVMSTIDQWSKWQGGIFASATSTSDLCSCDTILDNTLSLTLAFSADGGANVDILPFWLSFIFLNKVDTASTDASAGICATANANINDVPTLSTINTQSTATSCANALVSTTSLGLLLLVLAKVLVP